MQATQTYETPVKAQNPLDKDYYKVARQRKGKKNPGNQK